MRPLSVVDQRSLTGKKKYGSSDQLFCVQSGVSIIDKRDNDPSLRDMVKLQIRVTQGFCDVTSYWTLPTYQFKRGLCLSNTFSYRGTGACDTKFGF